MQIQSNLGSTIAMAFDECPSSVASREYVQQSVDRTTRWLSACKREMERLNGLADTINPHQLLFGINQEPFTRISVSPHAQAIAQMDLPGYAVAVWLWERAMRKCTGSWMRWFPICRKINPPI